MKLAVATALVAGGASAFVLKRAPKYDSFDCYDEESDPKGKDYVGIRDMTMSGRKCANWHDTPTEKGSKGIDYHSYCRNPNGEMAEPFCYTQDSYDGETKQASKKEICGVPKCKKSALHPEPFVATLKSEGKEPCEYVAPKKQLYKRFSADKACNKGYGDKMWLVGLKLTEAADVKACAEQCVVKPGSEFMTFFGKADDDGNNCGCYRDACVLTPSPGADEAEVTINKPVSYMLGSFTPAEVKAAEKDSF